MANLVSVPIWGLFNLTCTITSTKRNAYGIVVSVPIWGLFNLTRCISIEE